MTVDRSRITADRDAGDLTPLVRDLYRQQRELLDLIERLIRSERQACETLTAAQQASTRDQLAARDARAELLALRAGLTHQHTLAAWTCVACRCFNGEERMIQPACRSCGAPRPLASEAAERPPTP